MGNTARNSIGIGNSRAPKRLQPTDEVAPLAHDGEMVWFTPSQGKARKGEGQLCVLVVDDDPNAAKSLSMLMEAWGHEVWVAGDGAAALVLASAVQTNVLLLDIVMPNMDGCQVARRLRRQTRFEDTLLIALLGRADPEYRLRAEEAGFDLCLVKPVEPSTLEVLLMLEQDWLTQSSAALRATPRTEAASRPAKTRIANRFPAADEEPGCLSCVAHKAAAPTAKSRN
jgi:CheY-like chemotaxis protein